MTITELLKRAAALDTNEDQPTSGDSDFYPDPPGRSSGSIDATWGEPGPSNPVAMSSGVVAEATKDRKGVLEEVFSHVEQMRAKETAALRAQFDARKYESHSPLLKKGSPTLAEQVRKLV